MSAPLCKDCAFYRPWFDSDGNSYIAYCAVPCPPNPNIVNGQYKYRHCDGRRSSDRDDCGPKGKQFQPGPEQKTAIVVIKRRWF